MKSVRKDTIREDTKTHLGFMTLEMNIIREMGDTEEMKKFQRFIPKNMKISLIY